MNLGRYCCPLPLLEIYVKKATFAKNVTGKSPKGGEMKEKRIECREKGGKVHIVCSTKETGEHTMLCGLVQQEPFHNSYKRGSCYGKWEVTDKPTTCKTCLRISQ